MTEPLHAHSLAAALSVGDLQASLAWYRDALGFTVDRTHEREGRVMSVSLRAGDVRVLLNQDDGAKGAEREKGAGFSLMITTRQEIDPIADRIRALGGTLATEPTDTPWGSRMFRVRDPDGFLLVIASEK